jgi:hypothetical protein
MDDRTGRPEQIMAPALRSIIKRIDLAIENGSLDPKDRDEVIKMFISGPTTVVDNKAGGGMMTMENMTMPIGYQEGGVVPRSRQQSVMEEEAIQNKKRMDFLEQAMMEAEEIRRARIDPKDPESESMSTFGKITDAEKVKVAMMIAREQGNTSEENILKIINELMVPSRMVETDIKERTTPSSTKLLRGTIEGVGSLFNKMFGSKGE